MKYLSWERIGTEVERAMLQYQVISKLVPIVRENGRLTVAIDCVVAAGG